ncbi:hypothetical protein SMJ63A_20023 [Stenotrophomonas geniculata]|nr:protein of unknown function [Stenotrophomonas maltophilia]
MDEKRGRRVPPDGAAVALASSSGLRSLRKGESAETTSIVKMVNKRGAETYTGFAECKVWPYTGAA